MKKNLIRALDKKASESHLIKKFPHLLGGSVKFRKKSAKEKLKFLEVTQKAAGTRLISFLPFKVTRNSEFSICINNEKDKKVGLAKFQLQFPSGRTENFDYTPYEKESAGKIILGGFASADAGDLYLQARIYYADGSVQSDAIKTLVLSMNPDQLVITPRTYLVSGRAGRVEYDWDKNEFHCRANATITNGSDVSRIYNKCSVRVTDGGENGTLIDSFSFASGPFTVTPGNVAYRVIDTWFPKGSSVWDRFNKRWDLTFKFTYESTSGVNVSALTVFIPMSTVPINIIDTEDFTSSQENAEGDAWEIACEILEQRDITLYNPYWRILSEQSARTKYSTIDIGWKNNNYDFGEASDMYDEISGPEGDRLDVFIPLAFAYASDVPADKRNVGGFSTVNGPYPKDDDERRSGSLVLMDENDHNFFGIAIAHEICHYLGLDHSTDADNLMEASGGSSPHRLTWDQWNKVIGHGMMKWLAPDI
jgi:hypothetical protein